MTKPIPVYLEVGSKRVFAAAVEWPGWCRSARDEDGALQALADHATRYAPVVGGLRRRFAPPDGPGAFEVVERLAGNATTDFGAPAAILSGDAATISASEMAWLLSALRACWAAFDHAAEAARGRTLSTGPRGGGRTLAKIVDHVGEAERAYVSAVGWKADTAGAPARERLEEIRGAMARALGALARGEQPPPNPRRKKPPWPARFAVRRSAWHALDHAWEIEDRAT